MTNRLLLFCSLLFTTVFVQAVENVAVADRSKMALLHTAQLLPVNDLGEVVGKGDLNKQLDAVLAHAAKILQDAKAQSEMVKINAYVAKPESAEAVQKLLRKKFGSRVAITAIGSDLPLAEALVAVDIIAASKAESDAVVRSAPEAGAKNFAQVAMLPTNGVAYISGQADKGDVAEGTRKTLEKLQASLAFLGLGKEDVVQCKAFIQTAKDAAVAKKEFEKFFAGQMVPPLVFVDWRSKEYPVEIETIAALKPGNKAAEAMEFLTPPDVTASPVYSKIVRVNRGKLVYFSGFVGKSAQQADAEIKEIFADLTETAKSNGSDLTHLAKATYYVSNSQTSGKLNELRPKYFDPKRPPAASKATILDVGFAGKGIMIDMIGVTVE